MIFNSDIITGKICPYCNKQTKYVNNSVVYKQNTGMIYYCVDCNAYVGVHKGTSKSLGRLANVELRKAKIQAHRYFDNIWKQAMIKYDWSKFKARQTAYNWLSKQLNIPIEFTHIGMFDMETCNIAIQLCKPYYKLEKNKKQIAIQQNLFNF